MKNKKGFSLAEAMIMLTVISIIMAVSVPLIAKKTQIDTQTLFGHSTFLDNGNTISVTSGGFGNFGRVGIGFKNAVAKLHVRDTAAAANNTANNAKVIFQADTTDDRAFRVFGDGSTNLRTCVPDYANRTQMVNVDVGGGVATLFNVIYLGIDDSTLQAYGISPSDGYLYAENSCIKVGDSITCPQIVLIGSDNSPIKTTNFSKLDSNVTQAYSGNVMVPVSREAFNTAGTLAIFNMNRDVALPLDLQFYGATANQYFIPCRTTPIR